MGNILDQNSLARTQMLTEKELASRLNMSVQWVRAARQKGSGPKVTKIGRSVRYHIDDVEKFENLCREVGSQKYPQ